MGNEATKFPVLKCLILNAEFLSLTSSYEHVFTNPVLILFSICQPDQAIFHNFCCWTYLGNLSLCRGSKQCEAVLVLCSDKNSEYKLYLKMF